MSYDISVVHLPVWFYFLFLPSEFPPAVSHALIIQ